MSLSLSKVPNQTKPKNISEKLFVANESKALELFNAEGNFNEKSHELKTVISSTNSDFLSIIKEKSSNKDDTILKCTNLLSILDAQVPFVEGEARNHTFNNFCDTNKEFKETYEKIQKYTLTISLNEIDSSGSITNTKDLSHLKQSYENFIEKNIVSKSLPKSIKDATLSTVENGEYKACLPYVKNERENLKTFNTNFINELEKKLIPAESESETVTLSPIEKKHLGILFTEIIDTNSKRQESLNESKLSIATIGNPEQLEQLNKELKDAVSECELIQMVSDKLVNSITNNTIMLQMGLDIIKKSINTLFDGAEHIGQSYDLYLESQTPPAHVIRINSLTIEEVAKQINQIYTENKADECKIILTSFVNYNAHRKGNGSNGGALNHYEIPSLEYFNQLNEILNEHNIQFNISNDNQKNIPSKVSGNGDCFLSTRLWYAENDVKVVAK